MESSARRRFGKDIQAIIDKYHPIDIHMIHKLVDPPIHLKRLRQALRVLRRKNLVDMVVSNDKRFFYQPFRPLITSPKNSKEGYRTLLRRQDWFHNRWCFYWEAQIQKHFPEVTIIREHNIESIESAKALLQINGKGADILPDLLLQFPKSEHTEEVSVAFEIERTRKSD